MRLLFQSTLPARGATCRRDPPKYLQDISIHAPRTGSDNTAGRNCVARCAFQSTLPARGATDFQSINVVWRRISIHAPRTGSDDNANLCTPYGEISIHAPRTGSDTRDVELRTTQSDFNPRSPHGERRDFRACSVRPGNFNPRSPHGERQRCDCGCNQTDISIHAPRTGSDIGDSDGCGVQTISIHAPRTGSDIRRLQIYQSPSRFQSTLPARGATQPQRVEIILGDDFNPRSPHGERRQPWATSVMSTAFQSTLPARGATSLKRMADKGDAISIHAPRTGSDVCPEIIICAKLHFNPRSPHGERPARPLSRRKPPDFNPRSPHGERLKRATNKSNQQDFNPRSPHGERPLLPMP